VNANQHLVFETGTNPQPGQKWNLNQPFIHLRTENHPQKALKLMLKVMDLFSD
jgi:hypothetical protein